MEQVKNYENLLLPVDLGCVQNLLPDISDYKRVDNWHKLSQNLSQNSRKVTRTGRQPRTFDHLHLCTEQSNQFQILIAVCLLTSGPVWIRLALTMST